MLNRLSKELKETNNRILRKLFPYCYMRILGKISTKELDNLFYKFLTKLKIDTLIECGAHEATASLFFEKKGGTSIAIEANPFVYKNITPKSKGNFRSFNLALSNTNEDLILYYPKKNINSAQSTSNKKKGIVYDSVKVQSKKLDDLLRDQLSEIKNLALWLDVEGHQYEVLQGSTISLRNTKIIKIEVESKELFKGQKWDYTKINNFLTENNFSPVYRDFEYEFQFNILYISNDYLLNTEMAINSAKNNLKNKINFFDIITLLTKRKHFFSEAKHFVFNLFGFRLGTKVHILYKNLFQKST